MNRADCPYCNDGRGWQANRTGKNNTWHPADTIDQAKAACHPDPALPCGHCMRGTAW